ACPRVLRAVAVVPGLCARARYAGASCASEAVLAGLRGELAAVAWAAGSVGVRHGRHGDVPDWEGIYRPLHRLVGRLPRRRQPFASAARAQVWFEWRRTGNSLPIMTALLLPVTLLFLVFGHNDVIPTAQPLLGALAVPVFLAGLAGITAGDPSWIKNYAGGTPFSATLPLSTVGLMAAKLRAAARSTLASWALVAVAVPL